jgi:hypothetical protein
MKNKYSLITLLFFLTACQNDAFKETLRKSVDSGTTFIYQDIEQGYYEKTLFESKYFSQIYVNFDILKLYYGKWNPTTAIVLYDDSRKNSMTFSYTMSSTENFINLKVIIDDEIDLDEDITVTESISNLSISWSNNIAHFEADGFDQVMNIPFTLSLLAVTNSSIEIINKIKLVEL